MKIGWNQRNCQCQSTLKGKLAKTAEITVNHWYIADIFCIWTQSKIVALALTAGKSPKMIFWDILTKKPYSGMKLSRNDYWRVRNGMKQVLFNNNSKKAQKWCNVTFLTIFIPKLTIHSFFKKFSHFSHLWVFPDLHKKKVTCLTR